MLDNTSQPAAGTAPATQAAVRPDAPGPATQAAPTSASAAASAPAAAETAPEQGSPSSVEARLATLEEQNQRLRGQISERQQALNRLESTHQTELESFRTRMYELETADMDDAQRAAYEANLLRQRNQELEQRVSEFTARQQDQQNLLGWRDWYVSNGIPANQLNTSSWEAMQASVVRFAQGAGAGQPNQQPQPGPTQNPNRPVPPNVVGHAPEGAPAGQKRFNDIPFEEWEDWFRRAERGQLPPDQVPV